MAWVVLVGLLAAASYGSRLAEAEVPDDVLYRWSTFVGALIQYGIMLALVLAIARGFDRPLLALERPASLVRAVKLAGVALVVIVGTTAALSPFLDAGGEQGLVPDAWDSSRAAPFLANAAVVVLVAPFVEELLFRGLGIGLLIPFVGPVPAILVTGVAFGLAHGLVLGLPVLSIFGITLGWLRWRTGSVVSRDGCSRPLQRSRSGCRGRPMSERFDEIRQEIAENDRAIVAAVNRRLALVTELWALKAELGLDTLDPEREARLRAALAASNDGPLSDRRAGPARHRAPRPDEAGARPELTPRGPMPSA